MSLLVLACPIDTLWPAQRFARGLSLLPAVMHAAVLRFHSPRDRQSRLAARLSLRAGLLRLGCDASLSSWRSGPEGKPFLADHPAHFSFSHAPGLAVAALSLSGPVGVDVEFFPALRLESAGRILDSEEYAHVLNAQNPDRELTRLWTVKEAVLKARGGGFNSDPRLLNGLREAIRLEGEQWRVTPVHLGDARVCSLARQGEEKHTLLYCSDPDCPAPEAGPAYRGTPVRGC